MSVDEVYASAKSFSAFAFSYVFDGQPPDLKKQELAKRYFFYLYVSSRLSFNKFFSFKVSA